jgi:serine/threonine protein kinase/tetratricopeptide (TPR) repeat protein
VHTAKTGNLSIVPDRDSGDNTRTYVPLTSGTIVSHYRVIEKIGAGGMGEVYLAEDTKLDRKVALKFLPQHLCQNADCRARFTREAQATAKLSHPNIVTIFEVSDFNGRPFFAMEHVDGLTLKDVIAGKPLPMERIIEIGIQVCEGLQAAHEKGITHRDIKPSNILIDSHGRARIVDFGLASVLGTDQLTKTGSTLGTIGYMSPEQVRGDKVDHRTDLFSFGVVLYEMITGHSPFKADSEAATLHAITNTKPDLLARYRREVPAEIQTIIDKALEKDVTTRYQHADDVVADLKRLTVQNTASVRTVEKPRRLNSRVLAGMVAAVVIALSVVGYLLLRNSTESPRTVADNQKKILAVLPFKNMSSDPDEEYFCDGLTEELTSRLSVIQSLMVISRSSSMTFKGSHKTIPEVSKALGARFIIEGSVQKAGEQIRITAQLIDASTDSHIWTNSYTGTIRNVFDIQDSVTRAIVSGIRLNLSADESRRLTKHSSRDPLVYAYVERASDLFGTGTEVDLERGLQYLEQGTTIFKDNAYLLTAIAWVYWMKVNEGWGQEDDIAKAQEFVSNALAIDPELAEPHALLGWINSSFLGNQKEAYRQHGMALALDSNSMTALNGMAVLNEEMLGNLPAAQPLLRRLAILRPLDSTGAIAVKATLHFVVGDFCASIASQRRVVQRYKDPLNAFSLAMSLAFCDSTNEAISVVETAISDNPTSSIAKLLIAMKFVLEKDKARALLAITPEVQRTCRRDAAYSLYLGSLLAHVGAREEAYDWLENAVDRGNINYPLMQKIPFLDSLRGEDRFQKLMERVKYEWEHFEA